METDYQRLQVCVLAAETIRDNDRADHERLAQTIIFNLLMLGRELREKENHAKF